MSDSEYESEGSYEEVVYSKEGTFLLTRDDNEEDILSADSGANVSLFREDFTSEEDVTRTTEKVVEEDEKGIEEETMNDIEIIVRSEAEQVADEGTDSEDRAGGGDLSYRHSGTASSKTTEESYSDDEETRKDEVVDEGCDSEGDAVELAQKLEERLWRLQNEMEKLRVGLAVAREKNKEEAAEIEAAARELEEAKALSARLQQMEELDHDCAAEGHLIHGELGDCTEKLAWERIWAKRQAAAAEYKEKLGEVEALCSAELGRLEAAKGSLEPLNRMASAWRTPTGYFSFNHTLVPAFCRDYFVEVVTSMDVQTQEKRPLSSSSGNTS